MAGGFHLGDGKIQIIGQDGLKKFDTDDGLFHVINTYSGSVGVSTYSFPDGADINATDDYLIGACHSACTDVIGSMKFTLASYDAGFPWNRWCSVMGGSALWVMDGHALTGTSPDPNSGICQMMWYQFVIISSNVYLRRRTICSTRSQGIYSVLAHTISWKLKAGLYT